MHYTSDVAMNTGILAGLLAVKYLGWWWVDALFAILIGLWIVKNAAPILWGGISMLLDHAFSEDEIERISRIIREKP
jgi:ferrous-iron efflux pump FieF